MSVNLSDGEWKLMRCLWAQSPQTITALTAALKPETGWSKNTVITMLTRLEAKGAVGYAEGARARQYSPLVGQADAARVETESLLHRVYGGSLGLLVNAMAQSRQLTTNDIAQLQKILDDAKGDLT